MKDMTNENRPCAVWFAEDGEIFVSFEVNIGEDSHFENHPIRSPGAQGWIRRYLRRTKNSPPSASDVENFTNDLISKAYEDNLRTETFLRVGGYEGKIYVDLGSSDWKCAEIDGIGWRIIQQSPIAFRRNAHMHPLPIPEKGGSLELLNELANFPSRTDYLLFTSFLVNAYHPTGPYFHLLLIGEKGSAKSSVARLIQKLLHPSSSSLKGPPKDEDNLVIEAYHNRIVMIDNENDLGKWLGNALCRLATGTGMSSRSLYTNRDQMAFKVARPALVTAHIVPSSQTDLIERSIIVNLERPTPYVTEKKLNLKFNEIGGKILGAIFDAISIALANQKTIPEESLRLHRMADASYFIACASKEIGWESPNDFLTAIEAIQSQAGAKADPGNDPLIAAIVQAMNDKEKWEDTPTNMLEELKGLAANSYALPKAANVFSKRLNNLEGYFFAYGLVVETGTHAPGGVARLIRIIKNPTIYKPPPNTS